MQENAIGSDPALVYTVTAFLFDEAGEIALRVWKGRVGVPLAMVSGNSQPIGSKTMVELLTGSSVRLGCVQNVTEGR